MGSCILGHRYTEVHPPGPDQFSPADVSVGMKVAAHMEHLMMMKGEERVINYKRTFHKVKRVNYM